MKAARLNLLLQCLMLIAFFAVCYCVLQFTKEITPVWIKTNARETGISGETLFVIGGAFCTAFGLPRQTICFLGGYAFGPVKGSFLALVASVGGCISSFACARLLGRRSVVFALFAERVPDTFLRSHPFSMALLMRLLPIGHNLLTNIAAGISGIRMTAFVAGSTLGYVPQTVIFALLGSGLQINPVSRLSFSVMLFAFSSLIGAWILRHHSKKSLSHR